MSGDEIAILTRKPEKTKELPFVTLRAAAVGDEIITINELTAIVSDRFREMVPPEQQQQMSEKERFFVKNQIAANALQGLIDQALILQEAKREMKNPKAQQTFNEYIEKIWRENELPPLLRKTASANVYELKIKLAAQGKSYEAMKEAFRKKTLARDFLGAKIHNKISCDLVEQRAYYNQHLNDFIQPARMTWREIEVNMAKSPSRAAARKKAEDILARLLHDEDFDAIARSSSDGPTASKGGLYVDMQPGSYGIPVVNDALNQIPVGQVSQILEAPELVPHRPGQLASRERPAPVRRGPGQGPEPGPRPEFPDRGGGLHGQAPIQDPGPDDVRQLRQRPRAGPPQGRRGPARLQSQPQSRSLTRIAPSAEDVPMPNPPRRTRIFRLRPLVERLEGRALLSVGLGSGQDLATASGSTTSGSTVPIQGTVGNVIGIMNGQGQFPNQQGTVDDFNHDGISDPAVYLPAFAAFAYRPSGGGPDVITPFGIPGTAQTIPAPGAYDGLGQVELGVYLPAYGAFVTRPFFTAPDIVTPFGIPGPGQTIPTPGNFDGFGKTDIAAYLPSLGAFAYRPSNGSPDRVIPFGIPGAGQTLPAPADYFGSGQTDIAAYLPAYGVYAIRNPATGADQIIPFGIAGFDAAGNPNSIPVPGDYDGAGRTEIAVYIPSLAELVYRPAAGGPDVVESFGLPGDGQTLMAPGDYDGSGQTELAAYLPRYGVFVYRPARGGPDVVEPFGIAGAGNTLPFNQVTATGLVTTAAKATSSAQTPKKTTKSAGTGEITA